MALVEMLLPDMSGVELLQRFKADHPECTVIVLTGHDDTGTAAQAMKAGVFHYMLKPCSLAEDEMQICKALGHERLQSQPELIS